MASSWDQLGEIANIAQLTSLDAVRLISMIVRSASAARMHKRNCRQFARHLKLIGNLLEQLKLSELKNHPETREPLEQLEDALRRSYILVNSCQDRSYMYLLAMGWNIAYQFRRAQSEIDRYLQLVPLISLVDNNRVREKLEYIESNQCEYTFDEEDRKVQNAFLNLDPCESQTLVLKNALSYSYPNVSFDIALQRENEKLQLELQRCLTDNDIGQYEITQYLLGVAEITSHSLLEKPIQQESSEMEIYYLDAHKVIEYIFEGNHSSPRHGTVKASSISSEVSTDNDLMSNRRSGRHEEWHSDLLACCSDPCLCINTFVYPCGTFSRIATVAEQRNVSSAEVCNDLIAYSLILSCCCYTCCARRKLRKMLNIKGGLFDDFLSHIMCCCCALVQERRELEIRGIHGAEKTKTSPPPSQTMEYCS